MLKAEALSNDHFWVYTKMIIESTFAHQNYPRRGQIFIRKGVVELFYQ